MFWRCRRCARITSSLDREGRLGQGVKDIATNNTPDHLAAHLPILCRPARKAPQDYQRLVLPAFAHQPETSRHLHFILPTQHPAAIPAFRIRTIDHLAYIPLEACWKRRATNTVENTSRQILSTHIFPLGPKGVSLKSTWPGPNSSLPQCCRLTDPAPNIWLWKLPSAGDNLQFQKVQDRRPCLTSRTPQAGPSAKSLVIRDPFIRRAPSDSSSTWLRTLPRCWQCYCLRVFCLILLRYMPKWLNCLSSRWRMFGGIGNVRQ